MIDLEKLFEDWFNDPKITPNRLYNFSIHHVLKLIPNNPGGIYDTIIADSEARNTDFGTAYGLKKDDVDVRVESSKVKRTERTAFENYMSQKAEPAVKLKYGKGTTTYNLFFPHGLTGYENANDVDFEHAVNRAVELATTYEADLGTPFKTATIAAADAYTGAAQEQATDMGLESNANVGQETALFELRKQLRKNVYTLGLNNLAMPANILVSTFFDQSRLFAHQLLKRHKGQPAPNSQTLAFKVIYHGAKKLIFDVKGAGALGYQASLAGVRVGAILTVQPGVKVEKHFSDFWTDFDAIYVINNASVAGNYEVDEIA